MVKAAAHLVDEGSPVGHTVPHDLQQLQLDLISLHLHGAEDNEGGVGIPGRRFNGGILRQEPVVAVFLPQEEACHHFAYASCAAAGGYILPVEGVQILVVG